MNTKLGPCAGMFRHHPALRFAEDFIEPPLNWTKSRPFLIDQTELVELVNNLSVDEGLAPAFAPFPIERSAFSATETSTESFELPDGTFMAFFSLVTAYRSGNLPEAGGSSDAVSNMQTACKSRVVTQWWLVSDRKLLETLLNEELPLLRSADRNSCWVATFDADPKQSFWHTSIGFCLTHLAGVEYAKNEARGVARTIAHG